MAPGKKKGFKKNSKTQNLSDFLQDGQSSAPGFTERVMDWAETMEIEERNYDAVKVILPNAPKSARGVDFDVDKVPATPPFTAYVGNLPYDASEDDICQFFQKLKLEVTSVRIPRENGEHGRMRGFGYAEFPDRKSLIEALTLNNETMKRRPVKVSLATEHEAENERSSGRGGDDRVDRTAGDWRTSAKEDASTYRKENYGFDRESRDFGDRGGFERRDRFGGEKEGFENFDRNRTGGMDRRGGGGGRRDFQGGFQDRPRTGGGFDDWDRRKDDFGGKRDEEDSSSSFRRDNRRDDFRRDEPRRDDFRRDEPRRDDFPRRSEDSFGRDRNKGREDFGRRDDFGRDRRGGDDYGGRERRREESFGGGRDNVRQDDFTRRPQREDSTDRKDGPAVERPKLQLQPRSVPVETQGTANASSAIFGGAKPVDTAAKEREIEERLAKERESKITLEKKEEPVGRVNTGSAPRSRRSSEGGPNYRSSCSEDDTAANSNKGPNKQGKQRQSSVGSASSDQENNRDSRPASRRQEKSRNDSGGRPARNHSGSSNHANGDLNRKTKDKQPALKIVNPEPVVYTTSNKFSYLPDGDDEGNVSD